MFDIIAEMHPVSIGAVLLLVGYFIAINWIFLYRLLFLNDWAQKEKDSLDSLLSTGYLSNFSYLQRFVKQPSGFNGSLLNLSIIAATKESTKLLSFLGIVSTTAPFIGLFGTVVSLLGTFAEIGLSSTGSLGVVTAGVSDALVATAVGIFVATFAYTYHQWLKRKAYDVVEFIRMQGEALHSKEGA